MENEAAYDLSRLASILEEKPAKVMLFIEGEVPRYDISAGHFIVFEYLKIFVKNGYQVIFWPHDRENPEPYCTQLQQMGVEIVFGRQLSFQDFIEEFGSRIDVSILSRPDITARYIDSISANSVSRIIYFAHDLHFLREYRTALARANTAEAVQALTTESTELAVMRKADACLFFNRNEIAVLAAKAPEIKTALIPWIQNLNDRGKREFADRRGLIFLGGFVHQPNADAVKWLHESIYPLIRKTIPDIEVNIIGGHAPPGIVALSDEHFQMLGHVKSLDEPFQQARVFIAPLRFGAGFKGKIAMAQSYGLPVVTTGIGAEGMELEDEKTALVADSAAGFARQVCRLYQNEELWEQISLNSVNYVKEMLSPEQAEQGIMPVITGAAAGGRDTRATGAQLVAAADDGPDLELVTNSLDILSRIYLRSREEVGQLNDFIGELQKHIEHLGRELADRVEEIEKIHASNSWKATKPLRAARRILSSADKR